MNPLVLDAGVLEFVIASSCNEENNSELDKSTRHLKFDPQKIRGEIILHLLDRDIIIPQVVMDKLNSPTTTQKLSRKNIKNREILNEALRGRIKEYVPTVKDIYLQNLGFGMLESIVKLTEEKIRKEGGLAPENWREQPYRVQAQKRNQSTIDYQIEKNVFCHFYKKIKSYKSQVSLEYEKLMGQTQTRQQECLIRSAQIRDLLEGPSLAYISEQEMNRLVNEVVDLEMEAKNTRPLMIPDFEIRALAESEGASLLSYGNDFFVMNELYLKSHVELEVRVHDYPQSMKSLIESIQENTEKEKSKPTVNH